MSTHARARRYTNRTAFLLAAAVAVINPLALMSAWVGAEPSRQETHSTAVGEIKSIALGTRSTARLNTDSVMRVATTPEALDIALERGEALFEAAPDDARQLRVTAGSAVVRAQASSFSVRVRDPKHVDVLVREGQVTIDSTSRKSSRKAAAGDNTVSAQQIARLTRARMQLANVSAADVARNLEWTTGHLSFNGETLAEAAAEFNRYNDRKLVIADPSIRSLMIGGKFQSSDPDSFIAALRPMGVRQLESETSGPESSFIRLVGLRDRRP